MTSLAFTLVLTAALLHALWNALVKAVADRGAVLAGVAATHGTVGLVMVLSFPLPSGESVPYLLASSILHYGYYAVLFQSYRFGDLSQAYPISRGLAPVLVSFGAYAFADEVPSAWGCAGVAAVSLGIMVLASEKGGPSRNALAVPAAVALGMIIASYSVVDGMGVRRANSPFGYIGWLFLFEALVTIYVLLLRRGRLGGAGIRAFRLGLIGGLAASAAYGLVIYAKTLAPLGMISVVRESSVIIAAAIGVIWFGERPWRRRVLSACIVAGGAVAISFFG